MGGYFWKMSNEEKEGRGGKKEKEEEDYITCSDLGFGLFGFSVRSHCATESFGTTNYLFYLQLVQNGVELEVDCFFVITSEGEVVNPL